MKQNLYDANDSRTCLCLLSCLWTPTKHNLSLDTHNNLSLDTHHIAISWRTCLWTRTVGLSLDTHHIGTRTCLWTPTTSRELRELSLDTHHIAISGAT